MSVSAVNINKLVDALLSQVQALDGATLNVLILRYLNTATGRVLDSVGDIVGEVRTDIDANTYTATASAADDRYRDKIKKRVFVNNASGTPEEMISILKSFLPAGAVVSFYEVYPAKVIIAINNDPIPAGLQAFMQTVAPAGVNLELDDEDDVFRVGRDRAGERL